MREEDEGLNEFAVARHEAAALKAIKDKRDFVGGTLFAAISAAAAIMGIIRHEDMWIVGGLLGLAVAVKVIPLSEAVKLWPWGSKS